jgi:hypothetical protein
LQRGDSAERNLPEPLAESLPPSFTPRHSWRAAAANRRSRYRTSGSCR